MMFLKISNNKKKKTKDAHHHARYATLVQLVPNVFLGVVRQLLYGPVEDVLLVSKVGQRKVQ